MSTYPTCGLLWLGSIAAVSAMLPGGAAQNASIPAGVQKARSNHTMFGGTPSRNMVNLIDKGVPEKIDPEGGALLWKAEKYLLSNVEFDAPFRLSVPAVANGVLYVMTEKTLYAIKCGK